MSSLVILAQIILYFSQPLLFGRFLILVNGVEVLFFCLVYANYLALSVAVMLCSLFLRKEYRNKYHVITTTILLVIFSIRYSYELRLSFPDGLRLFVQALPVIIPELVCCIGIVIGIIKKRGLSSNG